MFREKLILKFFPCSELFQRQNLIILRTSISLNLSFSFSSFILNSLWSSSNFRRVSSFFNFIMCNSCFKILFSLRRALKMYEGPALVKTHYLYLQMSNTYSWSFVMQALLLAILSVPEQNTHVHDTSFLEISANSLSIVFVQVT